MNVDDFKPLAKLVSVYELLPDRTYVVLCGDKKFDLDLAHALLRDVRQHHLSVFIIATPKPKDLQFMEEKNGDAEKPFPGVPGAGEPDRGSKL